MPIPVKSNCSTRSMKTLGGRDWRLCWVIIAIAAAQNRGWNDQRNARAARAHRPLRGRERPATRLIVEVDMFVVDDGALLIPHDVITMQAVAVLVEIVFAFCAGIFFAGENGLADFCRIGRAGLVDRR